MKKEFKQEDYVILYEHCKIVEGDERSIICDLQREKIKFIPNQMSFIINQLKTEPLDLVRAQYKDSLDIFDSYIEFLKDENFAFSYPESINFSTMESVWKSPEHINNAMIEYSFENYSLIEVLKQLNGMLTKFIEIRIQTFTEENSKELERFFEYEKNTVARSIRLYLPYHSKELSGKVQASLSKFSKIESIIFYNSPTNRSIERGNNITFFITTSFDEIRNATINRKFLVNNIHHFYEAQHFNPYYNKKVAISNTGDIKNCLKNEKSFGNVNDTRIEEITKREDFQDLWNAKHDKIKGIRDHELRYNFIISNDLIKNNDGLYEIVE